MANFCCQQTLHICQNVLIVTNISNILNIQNILKILNIQNGAGLPPAGVSKPTQLPLLPDLLSACWTCCSSC